MKKKLKRKRDEVVRFNEDKPVRIHKDIGMRFGWVVMEGTPPLFGWGVAESTILSGLDATGIEEVVIRPATAGEEEELLAFGETARVNTDRERKYFEIVLSAVLLSDEFPTPEVFANNIIGLVRDALNSKSDHGELRLGGSDEEEKENGTKPN